MEPRPSLDEGILEPCMLVFGGSGPALCPLPAASVTETAPFMMWKLSRSFVGVNFFAVILYASLSPGLGAVITMFTYASGVAIPLIVTGVLAAKTNQLVFIKLAQVAPKIHRASGLVLMAAGAYLIYYYYINFLVTIL